MGKIIKLGIFAALIYFGIQYMPTAVEEISKMGEGLSRKGGSVSQGQCIPAAERASETFLDEMRNYPQPPFDIDAWDFSLERVREHVYDAEARCDCARDSCQRALQAIGELNSFIDDFDNALRGAGSIPNTARRQETIDRLLKRAREFDRQGN